GYISEPGDLKPPGIEKNLVRLFWARLQHRRQNCRSRSGLSVSVSQHLECVPDGQRRIQPGQVVSELCQAPNVARGDDLRAARQRRPCFLLAERSGGGRLV